MSKELFIDRTKQYFGKDHERYLELLEKQNTQGFFLNTNKADKNKILDLIDFDYEESPYTDQSYYHHFDNIGKTIAYDLGIIYPQEIAASLTSMYIEKDNVKTVVDMCAAPGGKTINILNRLNPDVLCIANEINHTRALILSQNLERLGLDNVIISNKDTDTLSGQLENYADIVILDAPCSSEGIVRKYPEVFEEYSLNRINELADIQRNLLEDAYRILSDKGQLIYSTCTYSFEEDENQITAFLDRHSDMRIVEIDMPSHSKLKGTVKLSPLDNTEGQFFCIMKKDGNNNPNEIIYLKPVNNRIIEQFIKDNLDIDDYYLYCYNDRYYLSLMPLIDLKNNIIKYGIYAGELKNNRFEPSHNLYRANSLSDKFRYAYDMNLDEYNRYIQGYEIKAQLTNNYYLLRYEGLSVGYGKCSNGIIKNKYPKGLRRML